MSAEAALAPVYYEAKVGSHVFPVLPGHHKVMTEPDIAITTLLGSCVAACIRDRRSGMGGLNHFLLPKDRSEGGGFSARYGVNAMEVLINDILKLGARKEDLEAKVFGAANVIARAELNNVGAQNAEFVISYLRNEGIRLLAADLGGDRARRVYFFPSTGSVKVLNMSNTDTARATEQEVSLAEKLRGEKRAQPSIVELF
ncbi:MAG: chemoreceptor glutamine deamidase CheD [Pseudomonadota bacterium]